MKLVKKLISAVAALSMAVSAFAAVSVNAATPTITLTATPDVDKNYVDVTLSCANIDGDNNAFGIDFAVDETLFDLTEMADYDYYVYDMVDDDVEGFTSDAISTRAQKKGFGTTGYSDGYLNIYWSETEDYLNATETNIITMRFPVINGAESSIWTEGYTFTIKESTTSCGKYAKADGLVMVPAVIAAAATAAPTATPVVTEAPTAEPTAEPTATPDPAAATVSELQESDADDKNAANLDYAKAIYKSFAGSELVGKRVAWTINGKTAAFDYAIADVDGDVVVGLVIMDTVADALNAITAATAAIVD